MNKGLIDQVPAIFRNSGSMDSQPLRRGRGRPRLPALSLTAPEVVAITPDQYRQVVDILASMILNHHLRSRRAAASSERPATTD